MTRLSRAALAVVSLWWLGACVIPPARGVEPQPETGLRGTVALSPACPGPVRKDRPCPPRPFSAPFQVLDEKRQVVARFASDAEGTFSVVLPPGDYTVVPDDSAPMATKRQEKAVHILEDGWTEVQLIFDSGMR